MFTIDADRKLLNAADIFIGYDGPEDDPRDAQTINLNDAFYSGYADSQYIDDSKLQRITELFRLYGNAGIMYWVAIEKRGGEVPEFLDVRRHIEFVKHEEAIRKEEPSFSKRRQYTIGEQ